MNLPITTKLAGVSYGDAQANIKQFGCEDIGSYALKYHNLFGRIKQKFILLKYNVHVIKTHENHQYKKGC
jgi:hypothetical protein